MTEGNGDIRYTVKEVLARIEGKLDMLASQMQQKADVSRIDLLERDLRKTELNLVKVLAVAVLSGTAGGAIAEVLRLI